MVRILFLLGLALLMSACGGGNVFKYWELETENNGKDSLVPCKEIVYRKDSLYAILKDFAKNECLERVKNNQFEWERFHQLNDSMLVNVYYCWKEGTGGDVLLYDRKNKKQQRLTHNKFFEHPPMYSFKKDIYLVTYNFAMGGVTPDDSLISAITILQSDNPFEVIYHRFPNKCIKKLLVDKGNTLHILLQDVSIDMNLGIAAMHSIAPGDRKQEYSDTYSYSVYGDYEDYIFDKKTKQFKLSD